MKYVVGLMSGTSVDGIDAALVKIEEYKKSYVKLNVDLISFYTRPFTEKLRKEILMACDEEKGTVDRICRLNFAFAETSAEAVKQVVKKAGLKMEDIDLIGSHGQTVYHDVNNPEFISTLQIGAGGVIAERTGVTTVSNFRVRDVAAGGEGAPLVPYVDYLLYSSQKKNRVLQNIGGIGNYTYLPAGSDLTKVNGSDTGPGNMLIDGIVNIISEGKLTYDRDGRLAGKGKVSPVLLKELMDHPFIKKEAPKTTGREVFGQEYARKVLTRGKDLGLRDEDIVATVTAFTANSIVDAYRRFIGDGIDEVIISGGGSYNPILVEMIRENCIKLLPDNGIKVLIQEDLGYSSEAKEAIAFAVLAYQSMKGRANNVPGATGARKPVVLGDISPGQDFFQHLSF